MMRIEIDPDVYALLEENARGFESPNDVLRRMLPLETSPHDAAPGPRAPTTPKRGKLEPLIEVGLIEAGDDLTYARSRKGDVLTATVGPGGTIITELGEYASPSPALGQLTGHQIDGWASWRHVRSGKRLRDLRADAAKS